MIPKTKTQWETKCLALWRKILHIKHRNRCELCGVSGERKQLHCHHYIGRKNKILKFDPRNGCLLCAEHHKFGKMSAHENVEWFRNWFKDHRPEDLEYLCEMIKIPPRPIALKDYKLIHDALYKELLNLENQ